MKFSYLIGVAAVSTLMQFASAQSTSYYSSYTDIDFTTDPDIVSSIDTLNIGGTYNNGILPMSSGDGINYLPDTYGDEYTDPNSGLINEVDNYADATSAATTGSASQFWGTNHFIDFTNNGTVNENVTLTEYAEQYLDASSNGVTSSYSTAYSGMQVYQNNNIQSAFFTNGLDSNGLQTPSYTNYTGGYVSGDYYYGVGTITFTLAPGETVVTQEWASGSTLVQPAPEPITIGLGIAAVGAVIRKRRKSTV